MKKSSKIILTISVIVCVTLTISIALCYFLAKPNITCCNPDLAYFAYSHPNNSTNHFSINVINFGLEAAVIINSSSFRFTNASDTYYSIKAFNNGTEISFPLIIEYNTLINITLELDWHFTVGSQYYFYLDYNYGKSLRVIFNANI